MVEGTAGVHEPAVTSSQSAVVGPSPRADWLRTYRSHATRWSDAMSVAGFECFFFAW